MEVGEEGQSNDGICFTIIYIYIYIYILAGFNVAS